MVARMKPTQTKKISVFYFWTSVCLATLGIADSLYLLVLKLTQNEVMCVGNHGCITVNNSPYSEVYGIPVSIFGLLGYLAILLLILSELLPREPKRKSRLGFLFSISRLLVFGGSLAGVLFSGYLTYIEAYVIFAYCPFCILSAVIMTILFVLSIFRLIDDNS